MSNKPTIEIKSDAPAEKAVDEDKTSITNKAPEAPPLLSADSKDTSTPKTSDDVTKAKDKRDNAKKAMEVAHQKVNTAFDKIHDDAGDKSAIVDKAKDRFTNLVEGRSCALNTMSNLKGTPKANIDHAFKEIKVSIERSISQVSTAKKDDKQALMDAIVEAQKATVAYVEAKQDHAVTKAQSQPLSNDFEFRAAANCKVNLNAVNFAEVFDKDSQGNEMIATVGPHEQILVVDGNRISTKGYQAGGDVTVFSKAVIAKAKRNPNEPIVLDGPQEGVLAVLKQLKKSGITNEIKLGPYIQSQQKFSVMHARHASVREYDKNKFGWVRNARADRKEIESLIKSIPGKPQGLLLDDEKDSFNKEEKHHLTLENIYADNKGDDGKNAKKANKLVTTALKGIIASDYADASTSFKSMEKLIDLGKKCEDHPLNIKQDDFRKLLTDKKQQKAFDEVVDHQAKTSKTSSADSTQKQDAGATQKTTDAIHDDEAENTPINITRGNM